MGAVLQQSKSQFASRVAGVCCVYDDERWLKYMMDSVYHEIGALFFLVGDSPWNGELTSNAQTLRTVESYPDPEEKIHIIRGNWDSETEQRTVGLEIVKQAGFELCFVVDADEIYDPVVLRAMIGLALSKPQVGCFLMTCLTYWKSHRYRIDPPEYYKPPIFVRCGQNSELNGYFVERRHATAKYVGAIPPNFGVCHHLSYARTNEELKKKLASFSHAHEVRPNWYDEVWLAWDKSPQMENLHPVYPEAYKRAVMVTDEQLPPVLRGLG
jgi:hypothetical protein